MPKEVNRNLTDSVIYQPSKEDAPGLDPSREYAAIVTGVHEKNSAVDLSIHRPGSAGSISKTEVPHTNFADKGKGSWKNA